MPVLLELGETCHGVPHMHTRYAPPPLDQRWLVAALIDAIPSYKEHPDARPLVSELVYAYLIWWTLMRSFPNRRIVATAPLWLVRHIHASNQERFMADSFDYLGRIPRKNDLWRGELDFRGTFDTVRSLEELFDSHALAWEPLIQTARRQKSDKIIRLH